MKILEQDHDKAHQVYRELKISDTSEVDRVFNEKKSKLETEIKGIIEALKETI